MDLQTCIVRLRPRFEQVCTVRFFRYASGETDYRVQDLRGALHVIRQPSPWSLTSGPAERIKNAIASFLPGR